jgi:uncharacterized Zn finger protein
LSVKEIPVEPSTWFYTKLEKQSLSQLPNAREFWLGIKRLPSNVDVATGNSVLGILIKNQGDFPDFWHKDTSFIETMEELDQRVKAKNQNLI